MRVLFVILFCCPSLLIAKEIELDTFFMAQEKVIADLLTEMRETNDNNRREMLNIDLIDEIENTIDHPGAMDYPFNSWTTMSTLIAPDGEFRIFNWNVENNELMHQHFCYIIRPGRGNKPNQVYKFKEDKITIPPRPDIMLTPDRWYGALYYKIIPVTNGNKTYYTVLGFSGKDRSTNMKILDVIYFKGKSLRLGHPLFQESQGSPNLVRRVFFEYSEKAVVSVNVNDKLGGIVFDHLVPEQENLEGMYSFYIPDMTYDAYRLKDGVWRYEEDVIAYNEQNKKIKQWRPTEGGDNSEFNEVKDFWINPVDPTSPVSTGRDATAPVEDLSIEKKHKRTKQDRDKRRKFKLFKKKKKNRSAIGAD